MFVGTQILGIHNVITQSCEYSLRNYGSAKWWVCKIVGT